MSNTGTQKQAEQLAGERPFLYRYMGTHLVESLRDRRLMVKKVSEFNDPFDSKFAIRARKLTGEQAIRRLRRELDDRGSFEKLRKNHPKINRAQLRALIKKTSPEEAIASYQGFMDYLDEGAEKDAKDARDDAFRVTCFSEGTESATDETGNPLLMWAHYGNMHRGTRIGLQFPASLDLPMELERVEYVNDRVVISLSIDFDTDLKEQNVYLRASLFRKSKIWEYEVEHRLVLPPESCERCGKGLLHAQVRPEWVRRVDFGAEYDLETAKREVALLAPDYPHVKWYRARYHRTEFKLEYVPLDVA